MKKYLFVLAVATATILGCGKDGEIGPQGPQGEKGEQGIKGVDGTVIHSGTSAPSASIGKVGDYYINLSTRELYGAKTSNGWGNPVSLKGEKGDPGNDGVDGSTIISGNGSPDLTLGKNGDFYIDLNSLTLHGPKNSQDWGGSYQLASNQNNGVHVYLVKNVKFTTPANTGTDYITTKPWFYYKNNEVNMGNVNIKKGIYYMYWRYNDPSNENNVSVSNYFDYSWKDIVTNGEKEVYTYGSNTIEFRIDPLRIGFNPLTNNNVIQWLFVGGTWNGSGSAADAQEFYNFREDATFDILIKYIPEASVTQIQKSGRDIRSLLSANGR